MFSYVNPSRRVFFDRMSKREVVQVTRCEEPQSEARAASALDGKPSGVLA
jgi:hypothetical protein